MAGVNEPKDVYPEKAVDDILDNELGVQTFGVAGYADPVLEKKLVRKVSGPYNLERLSISRFNGFATVRHQDYAHPNGSVPVRISRPRQHREPGSAIGQTDSPD